MLYMCHCLIDFVFVSITDMPNPTDNVIWLSFIVFTFLVDLQYNWSSFNLPTLYCVVLNCLMVSLSSIPPPGKPTLKLVLQSIGYMLLSWVASTIVVIVIALLLLAQGRAMSWFAYPQLIFPLYAVPSFVTVAAVHTYWMQRVSIYREICILASSWS